MLRAGDKTGAMTGDMTNKNFFFIEILSYDWTSLILLMPENYMCQRTTKVNLI